MHSRQKEHIETSVYSYVLGKKLYLNITNSCTNRCVFCVRETSWGVKEGSLWLAHQPSVEEILQSIDHARQYEEFVFCGFGEPLVRLDTLLEIAQNLKKYNIPIRINTNGQANLIHGKNIVPELEGLIDIISISLNAETAEKYQAICQSVYGLQAYQAILDFAAACKAVLPRVVLSVVERPDIDIEACRQIANRLGTEFRLRTWTPEL